MTQYNFLIAEPGNSIRRTIRSILNSSEFKGNHIYVENGKEALEILEQNEKVNLILSEFDMPKLNGLELLTNIKNSKKHYNLPFIMVTREANKSKVLMTIEAEIDSYIIKPFRPQDLEDKIKNLITQTPYQDLINLGKSYFFENKMQEAICEFEKAKQLKPNLPGAYFYIGKIYEELFFNLKNKNKTKAANFCSKKAKTNFITAYKIRGNVGSLDSLARIYKGEGEMQNFVKIQEQIISFLKGDFKRETELADAFYGLENLEKAIYLWDSAVNNTTDIENVERILDRYIRFGLIEQAENLYSKKKMRGKDKIRDLKFWSKIGELHYKKNDFEAAKLHYKNFIGKPGQPFEYESIIKNSLDIELKNLISTSFMNFAQIYIDSEKYTPAIFLLRKAASISPKDLIITDTLTHVEKIKNSKKENIDITKLYQQK